MTNNSTPIFYIPLEKFHIIPVIGLSPAELKVSAKKAIHDREKITHTTKLNAVAKHLGITGGFAGYEQEYNRNLLPFMQKHNLRNRKDLLNHTRTGDHHLYFPFTHQQVSEKLFYSKDQTPKKIFTGHNFDFSGVFGWHSHDLLEALRLDSDWTDIILGNYHIIRAVDSSFDISALPPRQQQLLNLDITTEITVHVIDQTNLPSFLDCVTNTTPKPTKKESQYKKVSVKIIDLILLNNRNHISNSYHLLGNTLTDIPTTSDHIKLYAQTDTPTEQLNQEVNFEKHIQKLLKTRFSLNNAGWVNTLHYNENLIFLSDGYGNFDFLIKNQRDKIFNHQVYGNKLKRADIPSFIEDYRFERWYYFEYKGNREWDNHQSENYYYQNGGLIRQHPGSKIILRKYYENKEIYHPKRMKSNIRLNGFKQVFLDEKMMMISELITISEVIDFLKHNTDYGNSRQGDSLLPVNSEIDVNLPASCTFYDVLAYVNWLEKNTGVPLRLLTYPEYILLRGKSFSPSANERRSDMTFFNSREESYSSHPPYMPKNEFDNLYLRFPQPLKRFEVNGLTFVDSNFFCEWLLEGVQIRSSSLTSFYMDNFVLRACGPKSSTGKYKGIKTGFRLCYEMRSL